LKHEGFKTMKMRIYYYTTINSEKAPEDAFKDYPDEIKHEGKQESIRLKKDTIEIVSDTIEYGEG